MAAAYVLLDPKPALNPHLPPVLKGMRPVTAALFGFLALQVLPLPAGLVRILSPGSYGFRAALRARVRPDEVHEPVDRPGGDARRAALFLAALFILGFLVLQTVAGAARSGRSSPSSSARASSRPSTASSS